VHGDGLPPLRDLVAVVDVEDVGVAKLGTARFARDT